MNPEWDMSCASALRAAAALLGLIISFGLLTAAATYYSLRMSFQALSTISIAVALASMTASPFLIRQFGRKRFWGWPPSTRGIRFAYVSCAFIGCCLIAISAWSLIDHQVTHHAIVSGMLFTTVQLSLLGAVVGILLMCVWMPLMMTREPVPTGIETRSEPSSEAGGTI